MTLYQQMNGIIKGHELWACVVGNAGARFVKWMCGTLKDTCRVRCIHFYSLFSIWYVPCDLVFKDCEAKLIYFHSHTVVFHILLLPLNYDHNAEYFDCNSTRSSSALRHLTRKQMCGLNWTDSSVLPLSYGAVSAVALLQSSPL